MHETQWIVTLILMLILLLLLVLEQVRFVFDVWVLVHSGDALEARGLIYAEN